MECDGGRGRIKGDVDSAGISSGAACGLEERSDEFSGGGNKTEVGQGDVFEEDVVAEDVGGVREGGLGVGRGGVEIGIGDGEDGEGGPGGEIGGDGGGGEEGCEAGELGVGG